MAIVDFYSQFGWKPKTVKKKKIMPSIRVGFAYAKWLSDIPLFGDCL